MHSQKLIRLCMLWLMLLPGQRLRGAEVIRLNGPLPFGGNVQAFKMSPDGTRVAYLADESADSLNELYSVPVAGGTPVKLTSGLVVTTQFEFSPDGRRVVFRGAPTGTFTPNELYSVSAFGGTPVKLNPALPQNAQVAAFQFTPDSSRVVYSCDQATAGVIELFSVPIGGGTPVKLNPTLVANGDVFADFRIDGTGSIVVYRADQITNDLVELFSVPILGGTAVKLNGTLGAGGGVVEFQIAATNVVYRAKEQSTSFELYSNTLTGSFRAKVNTAMPTGRDVTSFIVSPEGNNVVFTSDFTTDNVIELYRAAIVFGGQLKLNEPLAANASVLDYRLTPDGSRVAFRAGAFGGVSEVYSVPAVGGTVTKLNAPLEAGTRVNSFSLSSDGGWMVYELGTGENATRALFSVPLAGGAVTLLSVPLPPSEFLFGHLISPDSSRVLYGADFSATDRLEIYMTPIAGGAFTKITGPVGPGGIALTSGARFSPDGAHIVYRGDTRIDGVDELFLSRGPERWKAGSGIWDTDANWEFEVAPDRTTDVVIDLPAVVTLAGGAAGVTPRLVDTLTIGGGANGALSVLELRSDVSLTATTSFAMLNGGVLRGDGDFSVKSYPLAIPVAGEISAMGSEWLRITSGPVTNAGNIEAFGANFPVAQIDFSAPVTNQAGTGHITAHDAVLRFRGGLANAGSLTVGHGLVDILGEISNQAGGRIVLSGGATAIFYDDVSNAGALQVSAAGAQQSVAIFFGALSGNGASGAGAVFIEGDARPGFSPGTMSYGGDVSFGPSAVLHTEIGGTTAGVQYDRLAVTGELALGGTLEVTLINGFLPSAGMNFTVWTAGARSGGFESLVLPPLPAGLFWRTEQLNTTGVLSVSTTPQNYATFAAFHALTTPPDGDQDRDGLDNAVEYGLGLNPNVPDAASIGLPRFFKNGANDVFVFDMPILPPADLELEIQASTDLPAFPVLATRTGAAPWTGPFAPTLGAPANGRQTVTLTRLDGGAPQRFYRLAARVLP